MSISNGNVEMSISNRNVYKSKCLYLIEKGLYEKSISNRNVYI